MALKVLINKFLSSRASNRHFICIIYRRYEWLRLIMHKTVFTVVEKRVKIGFEKHGTLSSIS